MGKDTGQPPIGEAYDAGDEIVILGTPPEFPDSVPDDDPRRHNCDAMGCGCAHVRRAETRGHTDMTAGCTPNATGERPETQNELFGSGMILTVILRDDSPMIHYGDSPAYRSVRVDLTPEQVAAIAPRKTGTSGMQEEYESISKAFIEPNTKKGELK